MLRSGLALAALLTAALVALALRPEVDLAVAALFYRGNGHFLGDTAAGAVLRYAFWATPFVLLAAVLLLAILARAGVLRSAPSLRASAFLVVTIVTAPGLIVHSAIKTQAHRPRPFMVEQFGGTDAFRPFFRFDGACRGNCSFPSGEAALATWTLAPASLAPLPWRPAALAGAGLLIVATAGWRMAFGAHFLSDVCGAALITLLVVIACRPLAGSR